MMTMNSLSGKLRNYNKNNYIQIVFCISFAILLITSFASILLSPMVQVALPIGGDSRKQIHMIFAVAILGCILFVIYAMGLFLKYKSKETGVFLALGANKKQLTRTLFLEIVFMFTFCFVIGLLLSSIVSFVLWQILQMFLMDTVEIKYQFSLQAYGVGVIFAAVLFLIAAIMSYRYMKRTNIMDILNDQRTNESMKIIPKSYGVVGFVLMVMGIILGYMVPMIMGDVFQILLPGIWNVTFLFSAVGIYMIMVYAIAHHERGGRHPQRYYNNLISNGMMKFGGRQAVRNMCVISFLVACSLFASFYAPSLLSGLFPYKDSPIDFSIPYRVSYPVINQEKITELAQDHKIEITKYQEADFLELAGSGIERSWADNGSLIETYIDQKNYYEFIDVKQFNTITQQNVSVDKGTYLMIRGSGDTNDFWSRAEDLEKISNIKNGDTLQVKYGGTVVYQPLIRNNVTRYILNDEDYKEMSLGITKERQIRQILFNVKDNGNSYEFSKDLYKMILEASNEEELNVMSTYNEFERQRYIDQGKTYYADDRMVMDEKNPDLMQYWKYYPVMKVLVEKTYVQNFSVLFILFFFVTIICMAAVGIISYTRSTTIGINNKMLFQDLQKLGANNKYIIACIKKLLNKIFILPTAVGVVLMTVVQLMILLGNDGKLTKGELWVSGIDLLLIIFLCIYQYIIYSISLKKVKKLIHI